MDQKSLCVAHLSACFWGTSRSPNWSHDSSLEIPGCWLSNPSGISQFGAHLPLQNLILLEVLLAGAKGGRKVVFMVFLGPLIIQNLMKCFGNTGACINYHEKPKNINFSFNKCHKTFDLSLAKIWKICTIVCQSLPKSPTCPTPENDWEITSYRLS